MEQKINKSEALKKLTQIENEAKELRKIIEKPEKVTDRIKNLDDVFEESGITREEFYNSCKGLSEDEIGYRELKLIAKVLNEGWEPNWKSDEYKYWPYFNMRDASGFGFSNTYYVAWYSHADVGSRLCYKSRELAQYAGTTFLSSYKKMFVIN